MAAYSALTVSALAHNARLCYSFLCACACVGYTMILCIPLPVSSKIRLSRETRTNCDDLDLSKFTIYIENSEAHHSHWQSMYLLLFL